MSLKSTIQSMPQLGLLRAVPLSVCLANWGRHFRNEDEGMFRIEPVNDHLSQKTDRIDNFLSHDWGTGRFVKVLTLLWIFNIRAATIATFLISCLFGFLRMSGMGSMLNHWCSILFGYATFVVVLCWWQRIQSLVGFRRKVFLDKLCIAQYDAKLKQEGILGLAGFLQKSNALTILWTPRWATRLWCTYELAAFMQEANRPIELMPVKMAGILLMQCACWMALSIAYAIVTTARSADEGDMHGYQLTLIGLAMYAVVVIALIASMVYIGQWLMQELAELPGQLRAFRIQDAKCYCCAHGHRHPKTGERIPCDREYVYWMLRRYFHHHDLEAPESHLDSFNALVREQLAPVVLKQAGGSTLPLSYALYACAACNFPWLIDYIPWWAEGYSSGEMAGMDLFLWLLRGMMLWAYHPLLQLAMMRICSMMWKAFLPLAERTWRVVLTTVQVFMMLIIAMVLFMAFRYVYQVTESTSLLPAVPFVALAILDIALFWRCGEQVPASGNPGRREPGASSSCAVGPKKLQEKKAGHPGHSFHLSTAEAEAEGPLVEVKL
ncbi:unnamed protein product [Symbiodinium natans]|uniref:Uncharacterized protein n=1 Tax=Symbiodinium natans TaxID=878477 RepID=A0A812JSH4_9DINO|nr:unnamed protein product [Symbiodinium natans]